MVPHPRVPRCLVCGPTNEIELKPRLELASFPIGTTYYDDLTGYRQGTLNQAHFLRSFPDTGVSRPKQKACDVIQSKRQCGARMSARSEKYIPRSDVAPLCRVNCSLIDAPTFTRSAGYDVLTESSWSIRLLMIVTQIVEAMPDGLAALVLSNTYHMYSPRASRLGLALCPIY